MCEKWGSKNHFKSCVSCLHLRLSVFSSSERCSKGIFAKHAYNLYRSNVLNLLQYLSSRKRGCRFHFKGNIHRIQAGDPGSPGVDNWQNWTMVKTWLEASMLQRAAGRKKGDTVEVSVHPGMENTDKLFNSSCTDIDTDWNITHIFSCWSTSKHHIYTSTISAATCHESVNIKPFTAISTRSHFIPVFNQFLIIKLRSGPLICLHEHLEWLLRSLSQAWSMPPALFLSQRLSKGNNQTMTLWKTFPFVSTTY